MGPVDETRPVQIEIEEPRESVISWVLSCFPICRLKGGEHVGASQGGEAWMASSSAFTDTPNHHASDHCLVTIAFAKHCLRARPGSAQP